MLNFNALEKQFTGFGRYQSEERRRKALILETALEVFRAYDTSRFEFNEAPESRPNQLLAHPLEVPTAINDPGPRPTPITVVATDGSQIYPDRNLEPMCYLINLGRIGFQYGTTEAPLLESVPQLFFRGQALDPIGGEEIEVSGREVVSALRDELELQELSALALSSQKEGRPIVAIADGTLIRWALKRLRKPKLEAQLLQRFFEALETFKHHQIPLCSYISMPANAEFVNYLARYMQPTGVEVLDGAFDGVTDRMVFKEVLLPGQRSAIFQSQSLVLSEYPESQKICYFYVHVSAGASSEIARVEVPRWLVDANMLDLVHAVVLNECDKGNGYPMILSEAHEHAVVRAQERMMFYELIERTMLAEGEVVEMSSKKMSKDNPVL